MSLRDKGNAEKPSCYEKTEGIPALRIHLENGEIYILPYIHFQFAMLSAGKSEQILTLQFSSHIVVLQGHGLNVIQLALQNLELAAVHQSANPTVGKKSQLIIKRIEIQQTDLGPSEPSN